MSFEDDMIEDGFNNEMDYLEYLMLRIGIDGSLSTDTD